jgi:hypothetical protein
VNTTARARFCGVGGKNKAWGVARSFIGCDMARNPGVFRTGRFRFGVGGLSRVKIAHGERKTTGAARWARASVKEVVEPDGQREKREKGRGARPGQELGRPVCWAAAVECAGKLSPFVFLFFFFVF